MATALDPAALTTSARYDRAFYSGMAVCMALTVLAGFGPTYYFGPFRAGPTVTFSGAPMSMIVHIHGALFTAWAVLFIVQTALVAQRRLALHRRLGTAGAVLAASMVIAGALAAVAMAGRGTAPGDLDPRSFLLVTLGDVLLFAGFAAAALCMRSRREVHKRLMLLAYVSILAPAVARLPGVLPLGPLAFFGFTFIYILAGMTYDLLTRHRVHQVYLWGGGILLLSLPLRLVISGTETWKYIAQSLINFVA